VPSDTELVKLHVEIADIDEKLQSLKSNRSLSAGMKLLEQHAYPHERRKLQLHVNLLHEERLIERLEGECERQERDREFYQSPLGKVAAEKRRQKLLAGRALGAGSSGPWPRESSIHSGTDATAYLRLTEARRQHETTLRELKELCSSDADWNKPASARPPIEPPLSPVQSTKTQSQEEKDLERAVLVARIIRELGEIAPALELSEDWAGKIRANESFANFTTVAVCNRHSELLDKVLAIKGTRKPKVVEIACEIAAQSFSVREGKPLRFTTLHSAYKKYGARARKRLEQSQ